MSYALYKNSTGATLSVADKIRSLFENQNFVAVLKVFDTIPAPPTTTLCCVNPSSNLLRGLLLQLNSFSENHSVQLSVLSIGSGSGLFEGVLQFSAQDSEAQIKVLGLDIARINQFLNPLAFYCIREDQLNDANSIVLESIDVFCAAASVVGLRICLHR
ncbi:hypothetical protein HK100_000379 [Physocladia obscura]|uniref:Uncharacterized protein n=1 Tax=Physocladia obscura TaxID=109957 RepID=A0AAD5XF89_9FUNG|nr:hypothetical protein HK100_000379 [Physocladia obscura]